MNDILQQVWQQAGFKTPTEIQAATFDAILQGKSIQGLAPTGTGKTLAFGLPILQKIQAGEGLQAIILVSSQELAHQIQEALMPFSQPLNIKITVVTGNANVKRQLERLKKKPEIIVATTGRLMELLNKHKVKVKPLQTVILDEADALLAETGAEKVQMVFDHLPKPLQICFFGATTSEMIEQFAQQNRIDFQVIDTRKRLVKTQHVAHLFIQATPKGKPVILKELSRNRDFYGMAFFRQKNQLIKTAHILEAWHVPVAVLDGRKDSQTRQRALQNFRDHKINLLLTSDVAARGLDIDDLTMVVNFDLPENETDYIHRSGRTGRMGKTGQVLSMGNDHDRRELRKLLDKQVEIKTVVLENGELRLGNRATGTRHQTTAKPKFRRSQNKVKTSRH